MAMDSNFVSEELETLWRLAGRRTPNQHAAQLNAKLNKLRQEIQEIMLEMILLQFEQEPPAVPPNQHDIAVLLASRDARVRLLGIRLTGRGGVGGEHGESHAEEPLIDHAE